MKPSFNNPNEWVKFVNSGQLDKAEKIFLKQHRLFFISKLFTLRFLTIQFSKLFVYWLKKRKLSLDLDDNAIDLSKEFLVFWKYPNLTGVLLAKKIVLFYFRKRLVPARAIGWLAHWLVFQGCFKQSAFLFRYVLARVNAGSRLHGELLSFTGNYFYSREKYLFSVSSHVKSNDILKLNNDLFFQLFNIGTSAKTYAEIGDLVNFNARILASYDKLNPLKPDERYGMRVLIYASYLNLLEGNRELSKQFFVSAEKCYCLSGSHLDKSIYCLYKSLIYIFVSDLTKARDSISRAQKHLRLYGTYKTYEVQINKVANYLTKGGSDLNLLRNIIGKDRLLLTNNDLESWYYTFFKKTLPVLENFTTNNVESIILPLQDVTASKVEIRKCKSEVSSKDIEEVMFRMSDDLRGDTFFEVELFHSGHKYLLTLQSCYKIWRNPDILEAIRYVLYLIQSKSKEEILKTITILQSQKIIETETARRVAHDIKSPLAAMRMALSTLKESPANISIVSASAQKIEDITNGFSRSSDDINSKPKRVLVKDLFDTLISSKRLEYASVPIELILNYFGSSSTAYVEVNELELNRSLSNIINNAIEASQNTGRIEVNVSRSQGFLSISILDYGIGIESSKIAQIFEKDVSFRKGGSGLGLYYAKSYIDSINGKILITSTVGEGASVSIKIPLVSNPSWITTTLFTDSYSRILIADDFVPNLEMMKSKLRLSCPGKDILTFESLNSLNDFCEDNDLENDLLIVDFDFNNEKDNGLDFIRTRNLSGNVMLATYHYNEQALIEECISLGVRIIPKSVFCDIDIPNSRPTVLVADDEKYFLYAMNSKYNSRFEILTFNNGDQALAHAKQLPRHTYCFIDKNFEKSDLQGSEVINQLVELGFKNLYNISGDKLFYTEHALKMERSEIDLFFN